MDIRKILFWLHLVAGCVAGVIVLIMSLTGVLLTYERQILARTTRGHLLADPPPGAQRLSVAAMVESLRAQRPELPGATTLTLRSDPREPAEVRMGREGVLYVNAYSGAVSEGGAGATRTFFQKMTSWHRWLGVEGPGRATARAITGACNLAFLVLIITGAYLWLPRKWSSQSVAAVSLFRSGLSGKARDFNWHNVFGIWALVPLFFVVLTALPMSYQWANNLVYRIAGSEPPPPGAGKGGPGNGAPTKAGKRGPSDRPERPRRPSEPAAELATVDVNALWDRALKHNPEWKSVTANLDLATGRPANFTIDTGDGGQPQKRSTLTLNASTGAVIRQETFADANAGRQLRMWTRFVHTGEYYGIIGQTLAGLASLAGVMLVWTGLSLSLRRFAAWRARRQRHQELASPVPEQVA
jgi:uncharacterized iron-regulated membrane protein